MAFLPFKVPFLFPETKPVSDSQPVTSEDGLEDSSNPTEVPTEAHTIVSKDFHSKSLKEIATNAASKSTKPKQTLPIVGSFVINSAKKTTSFAYNKINNSSAYISFKLAMVDFFEHLFRLAFTITTKIVFLLRDLLINTLNILYSAVLIPLDLVLIVAHSTWLHFAYRILDKKRVKLTERDPSVIPQEEKKHQIQRQNQELADLTTTRNLFWSGKPLSIRSYFLDFMGSRINDDDDAAESSPFIEESNITSQQFHRHFNLENGEINSVSQELAPANLNSNYNLSKNYSVNEFKNFDLSKQLLGVPQYKKFSDQLNRKRRQELPRKPLNPKISQNLTSHFEKSKKKDSLTDHEFSYEIPLFVENGGDQSLTRHDEPTPSTYYKSVEPLNISQHKGFRRTGFPVMKSSTRHISLASVPTDSVLQGDVLINRNPQLDAARPSTMQSGSGVGPSRPLSDIVAGKKKFKVNNAADELLKFSNDFKKLISETPISPPILPSKGDESSGLDPRKMIYLPKIDHIEEEKETSEETNLQRQEHNLQEDLIQKSKQIQEAVEAANNISIGGSKSFYSSRNSQAVSSSIDPLDASGKSLWSNLAFKMFVKTVSEVPKPNPRPRLTTVESETSTSSKLSEIDSEAGESKSQKMEEAIKRKKHRGWFGDSRWTGQSTDESSEDYSDILTTGSEDNIEPEKEESRPIKFVSGVSKRHQKNGRNSRTGVRRENVKQKPAPSVGVVPDTVPVKSDEVHSNEIIKLPHPESLQKVQPPPHIGISLSSLGVGLEAPNNNDKPSHSFHEYITSEVTTSVKPDQQTTSGYSMLEVPILTSSVARSPEFIPMSATAITLSPEETAGRFSLDLRSEDNLDSAATITLPTATVETASEENENGDGVAKVRGAHMKLYGRRLANKLKRRGQRKEDLNEGEGNRSTEGIAITDGLIPESARADTEVTGEESAWVDEESDAVSVDV